jgi:hypothetical protein
MFFNRDYPILSKDWGEYGNSRMIEEACVAHKNLVGHGIHNQSMSAVMGANQIQRLVDVRAVLLNYGKFSCTARRVDSMQSGIE